MREDPLYSFYTNPKESHRAARLLFLIGAFSVTQINVGFSIGISEIFVYLAAPFLFMRNMAMLRRHGMMFIIMLGVAESVACVISGLLNGAMPFLIFKGLASTYPLFAFPVVLHHLLIKDLRNHKWLLLGICFSFIINIFAFRTSVEMSMYARGASGLEASQAIMSGPIFWIGRLAGFVNVPISGWYLETPIFYSVCAPIGLALFSLFTSESGRSSALGAIGSALIVIFARKKQQSIIQFERSFPIILLVAFFAVLGFKELYSSFAEKGLLGEKALKKYEQQTRGNKSTLALLMGGRAEFFIGAYAAMEKPFIGHGPWAIDYDCHYRFDFLSKYGTQEDMEEMANVLRAARARGANLISFIPAHSHLISFWLWFGIIGFYYWAYIIFCMIRYLSKEAHIMPQWFGFLAVGAPTMLWSLLFSGFGYRIMTLPYVVMLIMAHNMHKGRIPLPYEVNNMQGRR